MEITLQDTNINDIKELYEIQVSTFAPLYEIYHDDETSPATESIEHLAQRMGQPESVNYKILADGEVVGAVRIKKLENKRYHLSQINVLPKWQGQGIAQKVLSIIESLFADAIVWELDTIMQEKRNCYLYEKMGYQKTGDVKVINEKMTIITYEKRFDK